MTELVCVMCAQPLVGRQRRFCSRACKAAWQSSPYLKRHTPNPVTPDTGSGVVQSVSNYATRMNYGGR